MWPWSANTSRGPRARDLLKAVPPVKASNQLIDDRLPWTQVLHHSGAATSEQELGLGLGVQGTAGEWQFGISCPASLKLDCSRGRTWPDMRLQLVSLSLTRLPHPQHTPTQPGSLVPELCDWHVSGKQLFSAAAALALSYFLFPDTMGPAICALSKPGYAALAAPLLWHDSGIENWRLTRGLHSTGKEISAAVKRRFKASGPLERKQHAGSSLWSTCAYSAMFTLQMITGPAALLHASTWCLQALVPSMAYNCTALMGLIAALHEYNHLSREGRLGRLEPGPATEAAWHAAHKKAARRVGHFLGELPTTPPFAPVADLADSASITCCPATALNPLHLPAHQGRMSCLSLSIPVWPHRKAAQIDPCSSSRQQVQGQHESGISKGVPGASPSMPHTASSSQKQDVASMQSGRPKHVPTVAVSSLPASDASDLSTASSSRSSSSHVFKVLKHKGDVAPCGSGRFVSDSVKSLTLDNACGTSPDSAGASSQHKQQLAAPAPQNHAPLQQQQQGGTAGSSTDSQPLMLYGRADHAPVEPPTSAYERLQLSLRALYLSICFAPFMTLGAALLMLALMCHNQELKDKQAQLEQRSSLVNARKRSSLANISKAGEKIEQPKVTEASPSAVPDTLAGRAGLVCRMQAWKLLLGGCKAAGAAFQKWGQWSSTRGDLFPSDFCDVMSTLQQDVPTHSLAHTRKQIQAAFGVTLEQLFLEFDPVPIASGSIAQVHRAVLKPLPGAPPEAHPPYVAVKVRHPGVDVDISRDFKILKPLAQLTSRSSMLRGLSLKETLAQFSHTMTAQTDLRVEAAHLDRAGANFGRHHQVAIPRVVRGLAAPGVLVETWEVGRSVLHFCKHRTPINTQLVSLGVDAYLAMLLKHNFVHTDLHPGNILVRMLDQEGNIVSDEQSGLREMLATAAAAAHTPHAAPASTPNVQRRSRAKQQGHTKQTHLQPQVVLIDYGLAEELTPVVRHHFISFLNCISAGNGVLAAKHVLQWSVAQECPDPAGFIRAMTQLFSTACNIHAESGIDLDQVMKSVLRLCCVHQVTIDSSYAALAVAVCVLVGFATSLDPHVNLMDAATPCLLAYSLTGRVVGRMYS